MAVTPYCTVDDLEAIWSVEGVSFRADDDDEHSSTAMVNAAIEKATVDVNSYLFQQYTVAVLTQSAWVKWCTAIFACVELARRRGNAPPDSMLAEYNRYFEMLKLIASGGAGLPGDTGLAAPEHDNTPCVTNFRVDSRYRANVRRVTQTSTRTQQSPNRRGYDSVGYPWPYYW
ncbi:MAG: phage protein Gp36 family protein [Pirellulales bacterium]